MGFNKIKLSYSNYQNILADNIYSLPNNFFSFVQIDKNKYYELEELHSKNGLSIEKSFNELRKRVSKNYFQKICPSQSSVTFFSERTFPPYKFHLPEMLSHDWLATVDWHKEHCRDHSLHQPLTAYIVYKLLGGGNPEDSLSLGEKKNLLDECTRNITKWRGTYYLKEYLLNLGVKENDYLFDEKLKDNIWKSIFFETAFVSATFHDIGYPWENINRLNNGLSTTNFSLNKSITNAENIYKCFKNRLLLYPFNGYKSLKNDTPCNWENKLIDLINYSYNNTHGFPGAICFLYLYDIIRGFPNENYFPIYQFCVDWASVGIMMHDFEKVYRGDLNNQNPKNEFFKLRIDKDPLSCIVTLADFLEDFERPEIGFEAGDNEKGKTFIYDEAYNSAEIEYTNGELNITYKFNNWQRDSIKFEFKKMEAERYFDPVNGFVDLSSIGIRKVNLFHA